MSSKLLRANTAILIINWNPWQEITLTDFISQAAWCLKTRALTEQVYVDEIEVDEEGIAEVLMDDNSVAQLPS